MERGRGEEGFTRIRVRQLRVLWREEERVHTYLGPSIEDPMERGMREGSNILGSIY